MKIQITRELQDGVLTFKITCKEGGIASFQKAYKDYLENTEDLEISPEAVFARNVIAQTMFKTYERDLRRYFSEWSERMAAETYNWSLDAQEGMIEDWVKEWASERTKYYFNNDKTIETPVDSWND